MTRFQAMVLGAALVVAIPFQALAADPVASTATGSLAPAPAVESVAAVSTEQKPSVLDKFYLNLFTIFHGPNVTNMLSPYAAGPTGLPGKQGISFDNELTAAYMFNKNIGLGPDLKFFITPVMGQWFSMDDSGVKAFANNVTPGVKDLTVYTNVIVQAPTSAGSQARGMVLAVKTTPYVRYNLPWSHFTLGAWTEAKAYFGVSTDKTLKLYAAPYIQYNILKNLALGVEYEVEGHHNVGDAGFASMKLYSSDVSPYISWFITKKFMISPYLQIYTTNAAVTADRMAVGALFSATIL
ncbi:MAG: hypothetical protein ACXWP5_06355 [Bdellovibrionota bacterium]